MENFKQSKYRTCLMSSHIPISQLQLQQLSTLANLICFPQDSFPEIFESKFQLLYNVTCKYFSMHLLQTRTSKKTNKKTKNTPKKHNQMSVSP